MFHSAGKLVYQEIGHLASDISSQLGLIAEKLLICSMHFFFKLIFKVIILGYSHNNWAI